MTSKKNLRPITKETDHDWLISLHNDPLVLKNNTDPTPVTLASHMAWYSDRIAGRSDELRLIFTIDNQPAGLAKFIKIDRINSNCYLGADIHKDYRGKGYAKDIWSLMLDHCFGPMGLHRVALTVATYNDIGHHIYAKLGFKEEGRLIESLYRDGAFHDQILMYMIKNDWHR